VVIGTDSKLGPAPDREVHLVLLMGLLAIYPTRRKDVDPNAEKVASKHAAGVTARGHRLGDGIFEVRRLERCALFVHRVDTVMQLNRLHKAQGSANPLRLELTDQSTQTTLGPSNLEGFSCASCSFPCF